MNNAQLLLPDASARAAHCSSGWVRAGMLRMHKTFILLPSLLSTSVLLGVQQLQSFN